MILAANRLAEPVQRRIIFGLIVGALARLVLSGSDPMGWVATLALGIAGSVIGGFVASLLWNAGEGFQPGGLFLSLLGAILLLLIWRKVVGGTTIS